MNNLPKLKMPFSASFMCVFLLLNTCGSGQADGSIWSTVQSVGHSIGSAFSHSYKGIGRMIGLTKPQQEPKPALCRINKPRTMIVFMPISSSTQPPSSIFSYLSSTVFSRTEEAQRYLFTEPVERITETDLTKYTEIQSRQDHVTKGSVLGRAVLEKALPPWYNTPVHKKVEKINNNPTIQINLIPNDLVVVNNTENKQTEQIHRSIVKPVEANARSSGYEEGKEILMDPPKYITARANVEIKSTTNSEASIQVEITTSDNDYKLRSNPDNKKVDKNPNTHINETNPNPKLIHQKDDPQNKKPKTILSNEFAETNNFKLRSDPEIKKVNKTVNNLVTNETDPKLVLQDDEMQNKLIKALFSNAGVKITNLELNDEQTTTATGVESGYFILRSDPEKVARKPKRVAFLSALDQEDRILSEPEVSTVKNGQETAELPSIKLFKLGVAQGSLLGLILFLLYTAAIYRLLKTYLGLRSMIAKRKWRTTCILTKRRSLTLEEIKIKD